MNREPGPEAPREPWPPTAPRPARRGRDPRGTGLLGAGLLALVGIWIWLVAQGAGPFGGIGAGPAPTPWPTAEPPPRLALATLKALYDDPAPRPLIVDVRGADAYAAGHIAGAVSIPGEALGGRRAEIPHDRLVVLYCQ